MLHFVRENSIEKMGINITEGIPKSWLFVVVNQIETCQIKKSVNRFVLNNKIKIYIFYLRYNLPINTKFNRVSVSPLYFDTSIFSLPNSKQKKTSLSNS